MKRNQWTAALMAVLLFCCGAAVGALAHRYYASTAVSAKSAEDFRHRYVSEMRSKLSLTSSQVAQLETILDETKAKFKAVKDSYQPGDARDQEGAGQPSEIGSHSAADSDL